MTRPTETQLHEARKLLDGSTHETAEMLFKVENPDANLFFRDVPSPTRRDYILRACKLEQEARGVLMEELEYQDAQAAIRAKGDAVDAYRALITTTIPAHRIETRINGFKDGWDAAVLAFKGEDTK